MENQLIRVLIIEDSPEDAELIERCLSKDGLRVQATQVDNEVGLKDALDQTWDVVISDYDMPGFDGLRAFRLIRECDINVPFIMLSGANGEDIAVRAMKLGISD